MTPVSILFIIIAALTLGAALMVVTVRNLIHAALWLIVALFGIAVVYVILNAGFLAVAQVVIYIGAIAILMIFAIMLTRNLKDENRPQVNANWPWGLLLSLVGFGGLAWMIASWSGALMLAPDLGRNDTLRQLGEALVSPNGFVVPFEVASVLLLAALIGSILVAWDRRPR